MSENVEIFRVGDPKSPIVISQSFFNGMRGLDIRKYYFDKKSGELKPTSKGIWLREVEFKSIVEFLTVNKKLIENFFIENIDNVEKTIRGKNLKNNAIRKELNKVESIEILKEPWPGNSFFNIEHNGSIHKVILNSKFNFVANLDDMQSEKIGKFLFTYQKSKNFVENNDTNKIINLLELEWGTQIRQLD